MTDAEILARVRALYRKLVEERGLCGCTRRLGEALGENERPCAKCGGTGKVVDMGDGQTEPWSAWLDLPLRSSSAVVMGLVRPVECPRCKGTGRATEAMPA